MTHQNSNRRTDVAPRMVGAAADPMHRRKLDRINMELAPGWRDAMEIRAIAGQYQSVNSWLLAVIWANLTEEDRAEITAATNHQPWTRGDAGRSSIKKRCKKLADSLAAVIEYGTRTREDGRTVRTVRAISPQGWRWHTPDGDTVLESDTWRDLYARLSLARLCSEHVVLADWPAKSTGPLAPLDGDAPA